MGGGKNRLLFDWYLALFIVPDGVGVCLEVDSTARILPAFQNFDNRAVTPAMGIFQVRIRSAASLLLLVGGGGQHLIGPKLVSNLLWTSSLHTHPENTLYYLGSLRVNQPASRILRVLHVAIGDIDRQRYPPFPLRFLNGPDFAAGIPGIKFVEPVLYPGKIIVYAVGVNGIIVVVDGNKPDAVLREGKVGVESSQCGVPAQPGDVFRNGNNHAARFNFRQHRLKSGAVIGHTAYTVIHEKHRVWKMMIFNVLE